MKKERILIVDDELSIVKFLRATLKDSSYEVLVAMDGAEAVRMVELELPDLVILDIMIPNIDGFEVCRQIREWSQVPIIMLSARANENDKVKCLEHLRPHTAEYVKAHYHFDGYGCGLCQTGVPCESKIPTESDLT